jgi:hypothetical protein
VRCVAGLSSIFKIWECDRLLVSGICVDIRKRGSLHRNMHYHPIDRGDKVPTFAREIPDVGLLGSILPFGGRSSESENGPTENRRSLNALPR